MSIVAVVLAADRGEGFEEPKYLTAIHGVPLLEAVVNDATGWPVDEVIVVLGADGEQIAERAELGDVSIVIDPEWREGEASPIRAVLDLISRDRSVDLVVLARGDQRGVEGRLVASLVEVARDTNADAVVPKYRYAKGWPVVIASTLWSQFLGLEGSIDVHDVITTHAGTIEEVWFDHLAPVIIATADDVPETPH